MKKYFRFPQILILIGSALLIVIGLVFVASPLLKKTPSEKPPSEKPPSEKPPSEKPPSEKRPQIGLPNLTRSCKYRQSVISSIQRDLHLGISATRILEKASHRCMKALAPAVCNASVYATQPEWIEIVKNVKMSSAEVCYLMCVDECKEKAEHASHLWNISKSPIPKPSLKTIPMPKIDAPRLKVLHLTDIHYDSFYLVGSNAHCREPMCCHNHDGIQKESYQPAGKWGDYKCDLPKRTFEHALDFIAKMHTDIDYVIFTGDLAPHEVWTEANDQLMQTTRESIDLMAEKLTGLRVFPTIGNHDRVPVNSFPLIEQDASMEAYYDYINQLWSRWLPPDTSNTIRRGAFYSTLVQPGLRIISLNTNVCYIHNYWLLQNSTDPMSQLKWLMNELQSAETANEKVQIIGHMPPGISDCLKAWSHNYYKIIARYENTITGQFFGHTHHDEIELFYDPENLDRATNVAYISPPLTPYKDGNPAFRIFHVDGDHNETTRQVIDYDTWTMDLKEANLSDNPVWRISYSARAAYSMQSLRPTDWNNCIAKMAKDDELFNIYQRNYWRGFPFLPECSSDCRRTMLCQAKSGRSHDKKNLCPE